MSTLEDQLKGLYPDVEVLVRIEASRNHFEILPDDLLMLIKTENKMLVNRLEKNEQYGKNKMAAKYHLIGRYETKIRGFFVAFRQ